MKPKQQLSKSLIPLATAMLSLAVVSAPVLAKTKSAAVTPAAKVTNYTTAIPVNPQPFLMPYGYNDTARSIPQVIMSGVSPSIIDANDTSFEILALVRPGTAPLQKVAFGQGQGGNPLFNYSLKLINTLKNGDQFWKYTFAFEAGSFGNGVIPIKWGTGADQFSIQASDKAQGFNGNPFPLITFSSSPSQTAYMDTTKNDVLSYSTIKRVAPQIVMAGVSPAVVDIRDTSFDIVTILRPGLIPIQDVVLKQTGNNLFSIALEKKKVLNNGDQVWVATFPFAAGSFGTSTIPVVWGVGQNEYSIQVVDTAQQSATAYPNLRTGIFPAQL